MMNSSDISRYSRHLLLPHIRPVGQKKLLEARVLIIGLGGLGSAASLYLASAGIGYLSVADGDVVELSNLPRQILYTEQDVGRPKAVAAADHLQQHNSAIQLESIPQKLLDHALLSAITAVEVVLDCSDNFETRYQINRYCIQQKKILISAAGMHFSGYIGLFNFAKSRAPCYNCVFPENIRAAGGNCQSGAVFSPLVGALGVLQASAALHSLLRIRDETQFLQLDLLSGRYNKIRLRADPQCSYCRKDMPNI